MFFLGGLEAKIYQIPLGTESYTTGCACLPLDIKIYGLKWGSEIKPLMAHQALALKRYREKKFAPLFFEAGCGKSATALRMAKERFDAKEIDSLLIIAPNKIHKNVWYKEQVPMWLADITYQMQIFGGTGGAKAIKHVKTSDT